MSQAHLFMLNSSNDAFTRDEEYSTMRCRVEFDIHLEQITLKSDLKKDAVFTLLYTQIKSNNSDWHKKRYTSSNWLLN